MLGPLDGIPYTAKDSFMVRGMTVAAGSPAFEDLIEQYVNEYDKARAVNRLVYSEPRSSRKGPMRPHRPSVSVAPFVPRKLPARGCRSVPESSWVTRCICQAIWGAIP